MRVNVCFFKYSLKLKEITSARMFECRPLKSIFSFFSTSLFEWQEEFVCLYCIVSQDAITIALGEVLNTTGFVIRILKTIQNKWRLSTDIFLAVFLLYPTPLSICIKCILLYNQLVIRWKVTKGVISNNQRLRSAGDNDRRSKRFCPSAVLSVSFTWQVVQTRVIRLRVIECPNARDQSAFCGFHTFLVEVQTNVGHAHATCA